MDGEIITSAEMRKANDHYEALNAAIKADPKLEPTLGPARDFLLSLAWKGA